jgi:hypothetical protein
MIFNRTKLSAPSPLAKNSFKQIFFTLGLLSFSLFALSSPVEAAKAKIKNKSKSIKNSAKPAPVKKIIVPVVTSKPKEAPKKEPIKNEIGSCATEISIKDLVANPEQWLNKEVCFSGTFSAFSALALDYPPAMRERKNYISLTLLRPKTQVPLGELKIAMRVEEAQRHELLPKVTEGDELKIKGKVFSTALGEPWIDVLQVKVTKNSVSENVDGNEENLFEGF